MIIAETSGKNAEPYINLKRTMEEPVVAKKYHSERDEQLKQLPCAALYERSYMHKETISHVLASQSTQFLITVSIDGHLKFWKKANETGIEFAKHYRAHHGRVAAVTLSPDGFFLVTAGRSDKMLKLFDVNNYDIISMVPLPDIPVLL